MKRIIVGILLAFGLAAMVVWGQQSGSDALCASKARREELYKSLVTRVLSDKEMKEVLDYGHSIAIPMMNCTQSWSYSETEVRQQFADAIFQQMRLRLLAVKFQPKIEHRWASEMDGKKEADGCVWVQALGSSGPYVALKCPWGKESNRAPSKLPEFPTQKWEQPIFREAGGWRFKERYELDWCLDHGETRVIKK